MNTTGRRLRLTTFGESHGPAIGGVLDGFPSNIKIDFDLIKRAVEERRPGRRNTSARKESDTPEFLSGISSERLTLGTPIAFIIRNEDVRSKDYDAVADACRPGHADYTCMARYGIRDHRGGGRASARETAVRVVAGALADHILHDKDIMVKAWVTGVGEIMEKDILRRFAESPQLPFTYEPSEDFKKAVELEIEKSQKEGDSVGGEITCAILNMRAGIGNPVYDKLNARLAEAMMSINAAKAIEIGLGRDFAASHGAEVIDGFLPADKTSCNSLLTSANYSGGIQGGISNGMPVFFRVTFKPTPTIARPVPLLRSDGSVSVESVTGRHDPCVALRALPVVKAMATLTVADFLL